MISTLNIINLFFPRDTKRRALFKKLYYSIHSFLPRLSYNIRDCHSALLKLTAALGEKNREPVLIFDHKLGGGSNIYRDSTAKSILDSGKDVILIVYDYKDKCYIVRHNCRQKSVILNKHSAYLFEFISNIKVREIILNDLVSFPEPEKLLELLLELKQNRNFRLTIPVHDYYSICHSYNLLDSSYAYCGLPAVEVCENCLKSTKLEEVLYKPVSISNWRIIWGKILRSADEITVFSKSSAGLLLMAYPNLIDSAINLKPHKVDYINKVKTKTTKGKIVIGIPGNINLAKGSGIVAEMVEIIEKEEHPDTEIVIIGSLADKYCRSSRLTITGNYRKENLGRIIESNKINILFIPSIWPETFSFTTEEAILTGLPVAAFRLGAPAERLTNYPKALLVDEISGSSALELIRIYLSA